MDITLLFDLYEYKVGYINTTLKGTLMQIRKSPYMFMFI